MTPPKDVFLKMSTLLHDAAKLLQQAQACQTEASLLCLTAATSQPAATPATPATDLLRVRDVAALLHMSEDWCYRSKALAPARVKVGNRTRFVRAVVEAYRNGHSDPPEGGA